MIKQNDKKHEKIENKNTIKKVELDLKKMFEINKKLSSGERVQPEVVSNLLLSGIINILVQHDAIVEAEAIIKALEYDKVSNQARIEALENWVLMQDDKVEEINEKIKK